MPVIGWMGSPGNFIHVKEIENQLREVAEIIPYKFAYICREEQELNIPGAVIEHHKYGDDYFEIFHAFYKANELVRGRKHNQTVKERVTSLFDTLAPPYNFKHTEEEVKGWFEEEGFKDIEITDQEK